MSVISSQVGPTLLVEYRKVVFRSITFYYLHRSHRGPWEFSLFLYADDARIYRYITENEHCMKLQDDIDLFKQWADT